MRSVITSGIISSRANGWGTEEKAVDTNKKTIYHRCPMSLAEQVLEGNIRAAARLMRDIDDGRPQAIEELKLLYPHTGNAFIVGITGPPGAGKSTLVD